ncbi:MAG: methyltransferase family protein [Candidatus Rokuibacteriota bacterium]
MADMGYVVIDKRGRIRTRQIDRRMGEHAAEIVRALEHLKRAWRVGRWILAVLVLAWISKLALGIFRGAPGAHNVPFELWYGQWRMVLVATAFFTVFLLAFARPRRRAEWRNASVYWAFLISLFTEMFGVPLTLYLLAPLLGLPAWAFGMNESHLWGFALDRLGLLPLRLGVYLVMAVSTLLIAAGLALLVIGWATVYQGRGDLVTRGIYRHLRHPQYLGLILIVIGFNIMWPTLLTLVMAPILIVMYARLARREDEELATFFGEAFLDYAARTPAFVPFRGGRVVRRGGTTLAQRGPA